MYNRLIHLSPPLIIMHQYLYIKEFIRIRDLLIGDNDLSEALVSCG